MEQYITPKENSWFCKPVKSDKKPKVICTECDWSSWCKDAPWVDGCNTGKQINE